MNGRLGGEMLAGLPLMHVAVGGALRDSWPLFRHRVAFIAPESRMHRGGLLMIHIIDFVTM